MDDNSRYDPYVPRAGSSNGGAAGAGGEGGPRPNDKVERLKDGLREAQDVMKDNIDAVLRRGETLENLQGKTDELAVSAQQFRRSANQVRKNMWWKDMKMRIIIGIGIAILIVIIVVPIVNAVKH